MAKAKNASPGRSGDSNIIHVMPTKALFIEMLTRDITLGPAVIDLVDNCVDGARRLRGERRYKGLHVKIDMDADHLRIEDNCGGIEAKVAREYAFRLGRPEKARTLNHSIGRFGIGMKRAFFKIGKGFRVESTAAKSRFAVEVNVDEWAKKQNGWTFEFESVEENLPTIAEKDRGTTVVVSDLLKDVALQFSSNAFKKELAADIESRLQPALSQGLDIVFDGIPICYEPLRLLDQDKLAPAYKVLKLGESRKKVDVKLYCGLSRPNDLGRWKPAQAGWHVFCNGRLLLEADKSRVTGWGEEDETRIPSFHPQYNGFRGFAFFDCDDPDLLPWNTTKTGLNSDSPIYRAAYQKMVTLMRPVIDFLNKLKDEKDARADGDEPGPFLKLVLSGKEKPIHKVSARPVFTMPIIKTPKPKSPPEQRISAYTVPESEAREVRESLGVGSWKKVGEGTFWYYYSAECE